MLVIVVGARGAGKTTILNRLRTADDWTVLQPSTTRQPRGPDDNEYDFVEAWSPESYAWAIKVGTNTYGLRLSELQKARNSVCITVFEPINLPHFTAFREKSSIPILTVGLDTVAALDMQAQRVGGEQSRLMTAEQLRIAREAIIECDVVLTGDADTIFAGLLASVRVATSKGGLLVRQDMEPLIRAGALLEGTVETELRPASYDLRLGNQLWCQGKLVELTAAFSIFEIPPYSYAIVTALETAALPKFIAAQFDIKVSLFLNGIILSNGPQIDPGYRGILFCMLFNGSSRPRPIVRGVHFCTIDFRTTSRATAGYIQQYQLHERLEKVMSDDAIGGPGGTIMDSIDKQGRDLGGRLGALEKSHVVTLATIGALILAAIAIPSAILLTSLWDRVKQAEEFVAKVRDGQDTAMKRVGEERDQALGALKEATDRALQDLSRATGRAIPPARPGPPPAQRP